MSETQISEVEENYEALQAQVESLSNEREALRRKNQELLGKLAKLKPVHRYIEEGVDIDAALDFYRQKDTIRSSLETEIKTHYETAYEQHRQSVQRAYAEVEAERQAERQDYEQRINSVEQLRTDLEVLAAFASPRYRVIQPQQLLTLVRPALGRDENGRIVAENNGAAVSLDEFLLQLKSSPEFMHFFPARLGSGSGVMPVSRLNTAPIVNPWHPATRNLTDQGRIMRTNPELAKRLQKEAEKG